MNEESSKTINCHVYNGDALVGVLVRVLNGVETTTFEYSPDYQGPALSLSLPKNMGVIRTEGLPPFFCNLISEGWLEEAQTRLLESLEQGSTDDTPTRFDILAYFGRDCIGAIRVEPCDGELPQSIIRGMENMGEKLAFRNNALVPGVQPKFLAIQDGDHFSVANRSCKSTHIAKLPHENADFAGILYNEYVTTEILRALLPHDATSFLQLAKTQPCVSQPPHETLLIKRFDRNPDGSSIEFYEFNQLLNKDSDEKYDGSYRDIADFIRTHTGDEAANGIKTNLADIDVLFKRLLATILVGNGDAHLKNFALLRRGDEFRLSPNYDIISSASFHYSMDGIRGNYCNMALAIGGRKNISIKDMKPQHIVTLAQDLGIMSTAPTYEEAAKVVGLVHEVGEQVKAIRASLTTPGEDGRFSTLKKIKYDQSIAKVFTSVFEFVEKRWNGTLAGTEAFLNKKFVLQRTAETSSLECPDHSKPSFPKHHL